jgi:SagB-type dehydrogenase family enzyme
MTNFLSHLHADLRGTRLTRRGSTHREEDVPRGLHKEYSRMPLIELPQPKRLSATLQDAIDGRRSAVNGDPSDLLSLEELGTLLGSALRARSMEKTVSRNYPSGGALYPIETYLISIALESQKPGVFHYNPTKHALERLWDVPPDLDMKELAKHPESLPVSNLLVFTSVWKRSSAKYGDFTYGVALLEAGHMSENILLMGTALGLKLRPYAGFDDARIAELLDLDELEEQTVHTVTICKS